MAALSIWKSGGSLDRLAIALVPPQRKRGDSPPSVSYFCVRRCPHESELSPLSVYSTVKPPADYRLGYKDAAGQKNLTRTQLQPSLRASDCGVETLQTKPQWDEVCPEPPPALAALKSSPRLPSES